MIKIIFLTFVFLTSLFGLEDLGTYGSTNTIKEKNFMELVEEKAKDLNTTLLQKQFLDGEDEYLKVKKLVPTCKKTIKRFFTPTFIVPTDVILQAGRVIARAGEIKNTLEVMKENNIKIDKYMMFIDTTDEVQVKLSYMYKNQGYVFVTNGSINSYEKRTKIPTFKADRSSIEKFDIKCSPTLVIQEGNRLLIYEYNPKELMRKDDKK